MAWMARRDLLIAGGVAASAGLAPLDAWPATGLGRGDAARAVALEDPKFALRAWARLNGDPQGATTWSFLGGMVYGFLPQGDDVRLADFARRLYQYRACTARQMSFEADGSLIVRTRAWSYYADAETGALHRELLNPYTGKLVKCPPRLSPVVEQRMSPSGVPAEPVSGGPFPVESSTAARPMRLDYAVMADNVWVRREQFTRFHPADTHWFKLEADLVTHVASLEALLSPGLRHVPNTLSHNLVAEWQTWMEMHGTPGHILFVGNGAHALDPAELPEGLRSSIAAEYPGTLERPFK